MIAKPMNDAMWFVIAIVLAMVVASCVLDFTRLKGKREATPVATQTAK